MIVVVRHLGMAGILNGLAYVVPDDATEAPEASNNVIVTANLQEL
jgi:hypothetical protein